MRRDAVRWVEMLVGLVILAVGAALLLPTIESAREAGRRPGHDAPADYAVAPPLLDAPAAARLRGETVAESKVGRFASLPVVPRPPQGDDRKIIYNAQIELAVEDFAAANERVLALVKQFGAYVADSTVHGSSGEVRRGSWKLRVPVERFDEVVSAAKGIGELVSASTTSQDISEEYYDVDARIRNKTKEEERLLKLLEERPGKLEDVIAIERELSRVREELERMQGRMRVLANLTTLTTVDLVIREIRGYQPAEAPTLTTRLRRALGGSAEAIVASGENVLVLLAALVPWLPVVGLAGWLVFVVFRRLMRRESVPAA